MPSDSETRRRAAHTLVDLGLLSDVQGQDLLVALDNATWSEALHHVGVSEGGVADALAVVKVVSTPLADTGVTHGDPDRYEPVRSLGEGGMGRVGLSNDAHLHRQVAVKELLIQHPAMKLRFLREARLTAQLEHPGIVPVYELGQRPDGALYYTMKEVRGHTLRDALDSTRGLSDRLALLGVLVDLCQAVGYAHSKGVVHRDLKPENVMIGAFGETTVLDWGLAKVAGEPDLQLPEGLVVGSGTDSELTRAGTVMGTPRYMSPEQARGQSEAVDARSDVWAIGVMLYELLTGDTPFDGASESILGQILAGVWVPPDRLERGLPPALVAVCMKALEASRGDRYAHAGEVADELEAWRTGAAVDAHSYGAVERVQRAAGRFRIGLVGVGALALGGIGGALLVWPMLQNAQQHAAAEQAQAAFATDVLRAANLGRAGDPGAALARVRRAIGDAPDGVDTAQALQVQQAFQRTGDVRVLSTAPARLLAWTPTGSRLAWVEGKTVRVFDPLSGSELGTVAAAAAPSAFAFSPDEGTLWIAAAGTVSATAMVDLEETARFEVGPVEALFVDRSGVLLGVPGRFERWSTKGERLPVTAGLAAATHPRLSGDVLHDAGDRPPPAPGAELLDVASGTRLYRAGTDLVVTHDDGMPQRLPVHSSGPVSVGLQHVAVWRDGAVDVLQSDGTRPVTAERWPLPWAPTQLAFDTLGRTLGAAGSAGVALWSVAPSERALSNLRVCDDGHVVPLLPFPGEDQLHPPARACR